jgi:hypothetical protein|tara:strand:+ start:751 stop:1479 length:729 start_codon:yes stop_codon:yes gene_type:complete
MTKEKYELKEDVKPSRISSAYIDAPFDVAKAELEKSGYRIISLEESANLRVERRTYGDPDSWVKEGMLYVPNKGVYITKNSPIIKYPEIATQYHRTGSDYNLTEEEVKHALEDSIQIFPYNTSVPTDRFGQDVLALYLFGNNAPEYGQYLRKNEVDSMPIKVSDIDYKDSKFPFVRQIYFEGPNFMSEVDGNGWGFDNGPMTLHGVLRYDSDIHGDIENGNENHLQGSDDYIYMSTRGIKEE